MFDRRLVTESVTGDAGVTHVAFDAVVCSDHGGDTALGAWTGATENLAFGYESNTKIGVEFQCGGESAEACADNRDIEIFHLGFTPLTKHVQNTDRQVASRRSNERRLGVALALAEDIGGGDITSLLVPEQTQSSARIISRESAVICGREWVDESFRQVDASVQLEWHVEDGERVQADQWLVRVSGSARSLLTAERTALNFLQSLSGTATKAAAYAALVEGTGVRLLDTRKTLPGLRSAQKYAVVCGGCFNHRHGLFDAFLIKENHIAAAGGIAQAVAEARRIAPEAPVEVEVESLAELDRALDANVDIVMLDNFSLSDLHKAVKVNAGRVKLEVSGNVTDETIGPLAATGVDYISIGDLTKSCQAIDLSMRMDGA